MHAALRFSAAALLTGVLGGAATAGLTVLYAEFGTPVGRVLTFAVPVVLAFLIARSSSFSSRVLGVATAAGVALLLLTLGWSGLGDYAAAPVHNAGVTLLVVVLGAMFGLAPAAVLIVARLLLRGRAGLPVVTTLAVLVTAAFALWATLGLDAAPVTGMAAALAGAGVILTAPWWRAADRVVPATTAIAS